MGRARMTGTSRYRTGTCRYQLDPVDDGAGAVGRALVCTLRWHVACTELPGCRRDSFEGAPPIE